ncbi:MAG: glycosyltransferase family 4 protein [Planctomycetota bacterium]|jgi:glycosyltransferase involved in cell wall biosynthesis
MEKPLKILTLNYEYPPVGGGGATVTAQLCEYLVQLGHSVDVVTMRYKDLPRDETVNGVTVYRVPSRRSRADICKTHEMGTYLLGGRKPALKLARQNQYDIIHAHFIIPTGPLVQYLHKHTGTPYVITCHGSDVPGYNPDRFGMAHKLLMPFWKKLVRSANALASPSMALRDLMLKYCPELDITIIPNGYEAANFQPKQERKSSILLCSRLLPRKGFQYVIEAVKNLDLNWQVHIIGEGPYRNTLEQLADGSKTPITFHGWLDRDDPKFRELYETSSIFVFPSEMENFPTVLLEAMSAGCAIITSTAGGCPEVIGDAGLLVEPKNADIIRDKLLYLIENNDVREDLARQAVQRSAQFTWSQIAQQYLKLFENLINTRR